MILGRDISTLPGLNIKPKHVIEAGDVPLKVSTETIIDLGTYDIKYLNTGKITPEKSFTNVYIDEVYELEQVRTSAKQLHTILYAK